MRYRLDDATVKFEGGLDKVFAVACGATALYVKRSADAEALLLKFQKPLLDRLLRR